MLIEDQWTLGKIEKLVSDSIGESLSLEYKGGGAYGKNDSKRHIELTKDVSAFANSDGGTLIWGVQEKDHKPVKIDPVPAEISREWIEQIINTIRPKIDGVRILPFEKNGDYVYVIEIAGSSTAHMARDHKYYKRHNFMAEPMEDYEVRDVMNREKLPLVDIDFVERRLLPNARTRSGMYPLYPDLPNRILQIRAENKGAVLGRFLSVTVDLPEGLCPQSSKRLILTNQMRQQDGNADPAAQFQPLFPKTLLILREMDIRQDIKDSMLASMPDIRWTAFCDSAPERSGIIPTKTVVSSEALTALYGEQDRRSAEVAE